MVEVTLFYDNGVSKYWLMTGSKKLCKSWEAARYSNGLAGTDQIKFTFVDEHAMHGVQFTLLFKLELN